MGMKECSELPQSSSITGTSPSDCLVPYPGHSLWRGVLPLCRGAVSVFYSPNRLGNCLSVCVCIWMCVCVGECMWVCVIYMWAFKYLSAWVCTIMYIYPTPLHDLDTTRSFFKAEFNRFEFRVFLLLHWLSYKGNIAQSALLFEHI